MRHEEPSTIFWWVSSPHPRPKNFLKCRIPQTMAFNTSKTAKNGLILEDLGVICPPFLGNLQSAEISNSVFLGIQLELGTQNSGNAMAFLVGHLCRDGYFGEFTIMGSWLWEVPIWGHDEPLLRLLRAHGIVSLPLLRCALGSSGDFFGPI